MNERKGEKSVTVKKQNQKTKTKKVRRLLPSNKPPTQPLLQHSRPPFHQGSLLFSYFHNHKILIIFLSIFLSFLSFLPPGFLPALLCSRNLHFDPSLHPTP